MDNVTKERLEQLIDRATNPSSTELEISAMDAFCYAVRNDPSTSTLATKLLAEKIQSANKKEALNALELLEESMARCGDDFRGKINTFRFLNELIKLVSRKYNGDTTDKEVKDKILDLMLLWTVDYPEEKKVQESYNMLLKQGIVHEPKQGIKLNSAPPPKAPAARSSKPPEDPTTIRFRQLLCSKNPADLQAAQIMMVNMVREEEKKILRVKELERGKSNVELLNDMIDQFDCDSTSMDDWSLINDLFENCKEVQPTIMLLAQDQNQTEQVICEALETNDRLHQVMEKFNTLVLKKAPTGVAQERPVQRGGNDLDALIEIPAASATQVASKAQDDLSELSDIFSSIQTNSSSGIPSVFDDVDILKPSPVSEKPDDLLLLPDIVTPISRETPKAEQKPPGKPSIDIDSLVNEMFKSSNSSQAKLPEKPTNVLDEITIDIEKLLPDERKHPKVVLEQPKGLRVLLNFTRTHPKANIAVIVATISNQSTETISDIHLGATIGPELPSVVHLKLLEASGTSLAGVKPFRSAVEDITQVILIENPTREDLSLLCTVKYAPDFHQSITVDHLSNLLD